MIYKNPDYKTAIPIFQKFPDLQAVYLFGSQATGKTHRESDVDFGFIADENIKDKLSLELVSAGFGNFSLVYLPEATPLLQFEIVRMNQLLYERTDFDRGSYFSRIVRTYRDYSHLYQIQRIFLRERILSEKF